MMGVPTSVMGGDLSGRTVAEAGPYPTPQGEPRSLSPLMEESGGRAAADSMGGSSCGVSGVGPSGAGGGRTVVGERDSSSSGRTAAAAACYDQSLYDDIPPSLRPCEVGQEPWEHWKQSLGGEILCCVAGRSL